MREIEAVFIIAWHSKYNPWAFNDGLKERDLVKKITRSLQELLKEDIDVYILWIEDMSLQEKSDRVNEICGREGYALDNSLLIEVHTNAGGWTGIESLIYDGYEPAIEFSNKLLSATSISTGLKSRWVKNWKQYHIINSTIPLAIIFECGFIDNNRDRKVLIENIERFSEWIYEWLKNYIWFEDNELENLREENKELKKKLDEINKISLIN